MPLGTACTAVGPRGRPVRQDVRQAAATADGPRCKFWVYHGSEHELQARLGQSSACGAPHSAALVSHEAVCAAFGLSAVNVPAFRANCFFHAVLCHEAERRGEAFGADFATAERRRCHAFSRVSKLLRAARAACAHDDVEVLSALLQVRVIRLKQIANVPSAAAAVNRRRRPPPLRSATMTWPLPPHSCSGS